MDNTHLICEIANSHNGNYNRFLDTIKAFGKINYPSKGFKLQVFSASKISLKDFSWYKVYRKLYFSEVEWKNIIKKSSIYGKVWLDIFDVYGIKILKKNIKKIYGIKLQSSVLSNLEVLNQLTKINLKNKKIIINVSGYSIEEIRKIFLHKIFSSENIIIQTGYQLYPTNKKFIYLNKIKSLKKVFPNYEFSFADHLDPIDSLSKYIPSYAKFIGYDYIEKHICLDRKNSIYDYQSAMEPQEFREMVNNIKEAKILLNKNFLSVEEKKYLRITKQIPILKKTIKKGTLISENDLYFRRTSQSGLSLEKIKQLQSKFFILKKDLKKNQSIKKEYFRKSKIALIVGGRLKSSRLKKKAIRLISGKPSVQRCLESCLQTKNINMVVLATSHLNSDKALRSFNLNGKVKIFCGNPQDVISRYLGVCNKYGVDIIIRATADCPYVSNEIINILLKKHFELGNDYTCASNAAPGTAAEIYNTQTLKFIKEKSRNTKYSEYMTWYVLNNKKYFKTKFIKLPNQMSRKYRLCLDYLEDLKMFNKLFDLLKKKKLKITLKNIFKILDKNKKIVNINKSQKLIYKSNKKLIKFLNNNTKI